MTNMSLQRNPLVVHHKRTLLGVKIGTISALGRDQVIGKVYRSERLGLRYCSPYHSSLVPSCVLDLHQEIND